VQIGDPFTEKKLLECCLELLDRELLVSLQDLGAAGLTSAASEMASKGAVGLDIDAGAVPLREVDMEPFEIMVSESQERMLCVVVPERVDEVIAVCERWETAATPIGTVVDGDALRVRHRGELVADLPVSALVDDCPLYDLEPAPPASPLYPAPVATLDAGSDGAAVLRALLASPNLASRRPVYEQYDPIVQSRTVRRPAQADAAVLMLADGSAIAVAIDGNGRRVACDPRRGAAEAVFECAANLACVGAEPLGLTNCLNFGNPEKPHVAWQLSEAVEGLAEACEALGIPVVGGNVSLYNEAPSGPIYPTPVVGLVGRLPAAARAGRIGFMGAGDAIALVGDLTGASAHGSELGKLRGSELTGPLPAADPDAIARAHAAVRDGVRRGELVSAHDVAEGGIVVALAECCVAGRIGATVTLPSGVAPFAEAPGRAFVVSGPPHLLAGLEDATVIGQVGGDTLTVVDHLEAAVSGLHDAHERGLSGLLEDPLLA
jgi:phosphoribosylformylglycinamidine synthase